MSVYKCVLLWSALHMMSCYVLILHWLYLCDFYSCCFRGDLLADSANLIRIADFARSNLCMKQTVFLSLSLFLSVDQVMREETLRKARTLQLKKRRLKLRAAEQHKAADICGLLST